MDLLLANGFDVNQRDNYRQTPLHLACVGGSLGVIKSLAEKVRQLTNRLLAPPLQPSSRLWVQPFSSIPLAQECCTSATTLIAACSRLGPGRQPHARGRQRKDTCCAGRSTGPWRCPAVLCCTSEAERHRSLEATCLGQQRQFHRHVHSRPCRIPLCRGSVSDWVSDRPCC